MDARDWDRRYDRDEYVWNVAPNRFLPALVADLAPGRALDVACGEGRNAVAGPGGLDRHRDRLLARGDRQGRSVGD